MANEHYKTLLTIRTMVRDLLDEPTASFWTDSQLNRYINQAKDRVWNRVKALNEDYWDISRTSQDGSLTIQGESYLASSFAIVAGTTDYILPPDFVEMKLIEVLTSGYEWVQFTYTDMAKPQFRGLLALTSNTSPSEILFDIFAEPPAMRIAPKSDVALDLRITYVQSIADLAGDTERLTMPQPLYLAVVQYATSFALKQDRSNDAGAYEAAGDKIIAEMFGASHPQTQDVEVAGGYMEDW